MALERAAWLEREHGAQVEWLPFDLHPEYPPEGIPREELHRRYPEDVHARTREMVEASGLAYNPPPDVVPNSRKALELTELAREKGLHDEVHTRLMHAYWSEGRDIGDAPTGLVERLKHYFLSYKQAPQEGPRRVEIVEVYGCEGAWDVIRRSMEDYRASYGAPETRIAELRRILAEPHRPGEGRRR